MYFFIILLTILLAFIATAYYYVQHKYSYWERLNIPYTKPNFLFGNYKPTILGKKSMGETFREIYNNTKTPVTGIYAILQPLLLVCDAEMANNILIKDFQYFTDRGFYINEEDEPLSGNLFALPFHKWKPLRSKLAPAFTPGKLKMMFPIVLDIAQSFIKYLGNIAEYQGTIEAQDLFARYTTDIIGSIAFGIDVNSVENPNTVLRQVGKQFVAPTLSNNIRNALMFFATKLLKFLKIRYINRQAEDFFVSTIKQTMKYRKDNKIERQDIMQLLIELTDNGDNDTESLNKSEKISENDKDQLKLSTEQITAQAFAFFIGGFETSSSVMAFCLYELSKKQELQRKVQLEIDEILEKYDNLTFEAMNDMKYLEAVLDETIRMHPPVNTLVRQCNKPYKIPGLESTLEKGTRVFIPVNSFHRDEKYYPNPDHFNPDRFTSSEKKSSMECPKLGFGDGPRICIAMRLGYLQMKIGLVSVLKKFSFELDSSMSKEFKYDPRNIFTSALDGINLKVSYR